MKQSLVCLLALVAFLSNAVADTTFKFSGDAYVREYFKNSNAGADTHAFSQFFRMNVEAKPDANLTVKTGLVLSSNNWEGDNHSGTAAGTLTTQGTNDDAFGDANVTRLDHAVIEYSANGWITSAGRMVVTSPGAFLTSDDRRDRLQVLKIYPNYSVLALVYDKRAEGALTDEKDDVDMYSVNYYGIADGFKYAVQTGYWKSKKYALATSGFNGVNLDNIKQVTPQIETTIAGVTLNGYYTLLTGGSALYKDDHHSAALKLSKDFEIIKIELQSMLTVDGGLIAGGFDSLSSLVNNSPDHNQSQIKLRTIGFGLGSKNVDENFNAVRFSKKFGESFSASLAGGHGVFYNGAIKEKNSVADIGLRYVFTPSLALNAFYGKFFGDYKDRAGSLSLNATF